MQKSDSQEFKKAGKKKVMVCKCPMCDRQFGQRRYMYEHVRTVHSKWEHVKVRRTKIEKTDRKCEECGFTYSDHGAGHGANGAMCLKNQALMHEIGYVSDPEIKLDCRIKNVLAIKSEPPSPVLDLECGVCKMSFSNFGSLFGHVKRTHPLSDFVAHRQRRYKGLNYQCPKCKFYFSALCSHPCESYVQMAEVSQCGESTVDLLRGSSHVAKSDFLINDDYPCHVCKRKRVLQIYLSHNKKRDTVFDAFENAAHFALVISVC